MQNMLLFLDFGFEVASGFLRIALKMCRASNVERARRASCRTRRVFGVISATQTGGGTLKDANRILCGEQIRPVQPREMAVY
jgi:hypothetical protein